MDEEAGVMKSDESNNVGYVTIKLELWLGMSRDITGTGTIAPPPPTQVYTMLDLHPRRGRVLSSALSN